MSKASTTEFRYVIGVDLGDRSSEVCVLDARRPDPVERRTVGTTGPGLRLLLEGRPRSRVVIEAGTHSPWVDRLIRAMGHESIVANPREVSLISRSDRKTDRTDAETLARLARADVQLLKPIRHRGEAVQRDLAVLRQRDALVQSRTGLINHVRGAVKSWGLRLNSSSSSVFARTARQALPEDVCEVFEPCLTQIEGITEAIDVLNERIEALCEHHETTRVLRQVKGVGPVTALTFLLTIEDPARFRRNRQVGAYLGLQPRTDQSGATNRQLGITKSGDKMLRRLLVQCAHYILGPFGPDTTLRRYGLALAERGGGNSKKRAAVAVARRLAVLLLSLWKSGEVYEPLRGAKVTEEKEGEQTP